MIGTVKHTKLFPGQEEDEMQASKKATPDKTRWMRRGLVVLIALLLMAGAVIGIAGALQISTTTSSANVVSPSHLPFGLEADPAEHEFYRQFDAQCREQIQSKTYPPLAECR
jgi:hypothetical protein